MVRLSTVAVSTLVPALNVLSTTLPESTFFSVVRTNAPPLPGFTCWNSTTDHRSPSRLRTRPFFRSFVVAIACLIKFVSVTERVYRRLRRVAHLGQVLQRQPVTIDAQPGDHAGRDAGDDRFVAKLLAFVDVRDVHLDQAAAEQRA